MTSRSNYRVKVDLSKYYQDARRFSWIYVDCTNVWFISHVKQHIADIFEIQEPFHLLLNGKEFLPASEDVRVLKENELILVVPGSGIHNTNASAMSMPSPEMQRAIAKHTVHSVDKKMDCPKDRSKMHTRIEQNNGKTLDNSLAGISAVDATLYHSMREETETEGTLTDSKTTDDNISGNCTTIDAYGGVTNKRKRIRRKRSKNLAETSLTEKMDVEPAPAVYRKTKSLQLPVFPTGRHIHFDNADDRTPRVIENGANVSCAENEKKNPSCEPSLPSFDNCKAKTNVSTCLSTLLALRQCSTPLTFVNKKAKRVNENELQDSAKNNVNTESCDSGKNSQAGQDDGQSNGNDEAIKMTEEPRDYSHIDPEKYPSLDIAPELDDIIAFKTLKIGNEYTPEISDYIVARTMSWCTKRSLYTFQILSGHTQIQTPIGKFSLQEDESESQTCDTAKLSFSQLISPRLIYRRPK